MWIASVAVAEGRHIYPEPHPIDVDCNPPLAGVDVDGPVVDTMLTPSCYTVPMDVDGNGVNNVTVLCDQGHVDSSMHMGGLGEKCRGVPVGHRLNPCVDPVGHNLLIDNPAHARKLECSQRSDSTVSSSSEDDTPCSSPSSICAESETSLYVPTPQKEKRMPAYDLGNKVYVGQSSQIQKFVDSINVDSVCNATVACSGKLVPVEEFDFGLGGALKNKFQCSGYGLREKFL